MMDVEFAVQVLVLEHSKTEPSLIPNVGNIALLQHAEAVGLLPPGVTPQQARATYVSNLRAAARVLAPHGITLLIEPINTRNMPGYFLNFQQQAHDFPPGLAVLRRDPGCRRLFGQHFHNNSVTELHGTV
jgi:hypothetical protein